ncbi:MAG: ATP-binding cassette domain-containing protein [Polaromonas sp.]|nr:ATP-binding cassette domain-containing protein [Polaromonas sp.]
MAQIQSLGFGYGKHRIFDKLNATINPGVTLIQGGDGRGKSTLMRLLAGELKPDSGSIDIDGDAPSQLFWIDPRIEAFDQVVASDFFSQQRALYPRFNDAMLARLVTGLDLDSHIHKKLFMLSTGSKRKVFIAAALASGAPVTLLDMPFAAIDKPSKDFLLVQFRLAAGSSDRALVVADYEPPDGVRFAGVVDLGN